MKSVLSRFVILLWSGLALAGAAVSSDPAPSQPAAESSIDDPSKLLADDPAWRQTVERKLQAFVGATGTKILIQFHAKSPSEAEDNKPGVYMHTIADRLGISQRGVLLIYFADEDDWRAWIGDESAPTFVGKSGTAEEFTKSGAMHEVKEAFLTAAHERAEAAALRLKETSGSDRPVATGQRLILQTDALIDGLIEKLSPR